MTIPAISFEHVKKSYGDNLILDDLSFTIERGEFITLIGRSGCGKTTALKLVNGLLQKDSGRILVEGKDISEVDVISLRRNIGYVIQNIGLFPHMNISKNISYVPSLSKKWDKVEKRKKTKELLEIVGLDETFSLRYPSELSGGQKQRVGVARALAANPSILLMDEPFGAIDEIARRALQNEIMNLQKRLNITIMFVTHDISEAMKLGHRVMIMDEGKIVQFDKPEIIQNNPVNEFVKELISSR